MEFSKEEYNAEPVYYCKHCLSLRIRNEAILEGLDYCDNCGSTSIYTTSIEKWEKMYINKYGHKFLENRKYY